jgi:adenylate kinase family enzyme
MTEKLFLLGRPGSGKSTIRRYITKIAQHEFWSPYPISDTKILQNMCAADREHIHIRPAEFAGFEVLDFSILDNALKSIEGRVEKALERHELDRPRIAIIEFARSDYVQALSQFDPTFLKDAHFLILESDINTCMKRIYERTRCHEFADDMYVPGNIMEGYYQVDATQETVHQLQKALGLSGHRIQLMRTDIPRDECLYDCVRPFARTLLAPDSQTRRITGPLVTSHTSYARNYSNLCPSPRRDMQVDEVNGGVEDNEQLDDTHERQLVGSTSN